MNGESYVLLALGILLVLIRTGYRIYQVGFKGWDVDDYLMPVAVVSEARASIFTPWREQTRIKTTDANANLCLRPPTQP